VLSGLCFLDCAFWAVLSRHFTPPPFQYLHDPPPPLATAKLTWPPQKQTPNFPPPHK
jgi:hypothetical protein